MLSLCFLPARAAVPSARLVCVRAASGQPAAGRTDDPQFRPLDIGRRREVVQQARERRRATLPPPRHERQPVNQQWGDVWPAPRTFHPDAVPLPLRQGFVKRPNAQAPPGKHANAELMKIANFLHLTPPVIERQCRALAKFCTPWPEGLTDERLDELRPLEVITQDFVHASPTLRHPDARVVSLKIPLSCLDLTETDRDKLLRLVGDRHDPKTDVITLTADRCPLRRQNRDYALYLLTVLYFESCKREPWEAELRTVADAEKFVWAGSASEAAVAPLGAAADVVNSYGEAVTRLHNEGEDESTLAEYRKAVVALLGLPEHVGAN
ncbi:28S ribosomal protein S35, mitochondrial-like [Amphibalanus amphitrite]|uniref:28S ribosomal protein S35, mitochondrial-like n=1 Tax=Amphibalanus amphitrite TaxID=1232801 RepID=UPI001C8FB2FD|nr:28S ribosomal protein S35, mitochondrial-like [Amphibalanus amphitrite]